MLKDPEKDFVPVNQILGKPASIGMIPANQLIPWLAIAIASYLLTNGFSSLGMPWFFGVTFWLIVSWWLLTGNKPHLFVDKFRMPPGYEWCNGNLRYLSPLLENRPKALRQRIQDTQTRIHIKPIVAPDQNGRRRRFMPFQNYQDLVGLVTIKKDRREVSGYLLNKGKQYQIVFGFRTSGFHNLLSRSEIANAISNLEEGLKDIPPGEKMTIRTACYGQDSDRQQALAQTADTCNLQPIAILMRNEQKRIQELTLNGTRQEWEQIIFCTWTFNRDSGATSKDFVAKAIGAFYQLGAKTVGWFTDNEQIYQERFYKRLLLQSFEEGYIRWELLLNTKIGLEVRPCNSSELWRWMWHQFNHHDIPAPPIPQLLQLEETPTDYRLEEIKHSEKDSCTVLIEGQFGRSSCPEHKGSNDCIWLPGRNAKCAVLTMEEKPEGWNNQREQLRWLWKILSKTYVRDTEAVVEISAASNTLIQDNLARQAKQSKSAKQRALTKGQGRDAGAEVKAEESFDAQKKLYKGAKAIYAAVAFLVYRPTSDQLNLACMTLANSFGSAKVLRERNIAWAIWLETLPTTTSWLLHSSSLLEERRQVFDTETIAGVLPLTVVRSLDAKGVEFLTEGGKPVYIDLIHNSASRAIITGESGSGKSVLGWRFVLDALAANIPVVGIDISSGSGSTFKTAVELLGDRGAYYDITRCSSNLLEPPDLRQFAKEDRAPRLEQWKEFIRKALTSIAMGKIDDPKLAQRVDSIMKEKTNNRHLLQYTMIKKPYKSLIKGITLFLFVFIFTTVANAQQPPCNDPELQENYDRNDSDYHQYRLTSIICLANQLGCNKEKVFETMISQTRFIAPSENSSPVQDCKITILDIPGPFGDDPIRTTIDSDNYSITNYTKPDHALHPGKVTRTIIHEFGYILVVTVGEGIGIFPNINEWFSPAIWNPVDRKLTDAVYSRITFLDAVGLVYQVRSHPEREIVYVDIPIGLEPQGGFMIGDISIEQPFGIERLQQGNGEQVFWLTKRLARQIIDHPSGFEGNLTWQVLDVIKVPQEFTVQGSYPACTQHGQSDPEIIAVIDYSSDKNQSQWITQFEQVWRANRQTQEFEPINSNGIQCPSLYWGL